MTGDGTVADRALLAVDPDSVWASADGENFPVALRLLPADVRRDLRAVYGFARLVDDIGDGRLVADPAARAGLLDEFEADLDRVWTGEPTLPVLSELQRTVRARGLRPEPFHDLVAANRADLTVRRYATFDDLRAYCRLSADPVGRIVLAIFGAATPEREALSDEVCTALQVLEHLQDVREDWFRGVVYLPQDELRAAGLADTDLAGATTPPALRTLVAGRTAQARRSLAAGTTLAASLRGFARLAVVGFTAGGLAAADALDAAHHDVLAVQATPRRSRLARHAGAVLWGAVREGAR